ncbi:MAG: hypothetical protein WCT23_09555 [Candidatus Neomarinimicrobiota bacterium]
MSDTPHYDNILFQEKLRTAETESDYKLFSMLKPRVFIDGDHWCCLYGENLQVGIVGFGKSPVAAIRQWNAEWYKTLSAAERGE